MTEPTPRAGLGKVDSKAFLPGLDLCAAFYGEAVEPILRQHFPHLRYAAARIGPGSDVLGFDDPRSTDHFWGPLLNVFLAEEDLETFRQPISEVLGEELPFEVRGYSTHFRQTEELGHLAHLEAATSRPINHGVMLNAVRPYFRGYLGADPLDDLQPVDWLLMSEQCMRMLTTGQVFRDDIGDLSRARAALGYYPHDLWLYLLAAEWARIGQEEAFLGRTGDIGDELGSRLLGARLVGEVMRLAFLLERTYAPYSKWFGTAFNLLACAPALGPHLDATLSAPDWHTREQHLVRAYEQVAAMHNALGITEPVPDAIASYHGRPYLVIHADRFAEACQRAIPSDVVRNLPGQVGSVNQWAPDLLERPRLLARLRAAYVEK
jgi:hypothetical protein